MAMITWSDNLSVNVGEIDMQHKKLVVMINELYDAMKIGKGKETVQKELQIPYSDIKEAIVTVTF